MAVMPFDYFFDAFDIEKDIARVIRILRLLKINRIMGLRTEMKNSLEKGHEYAKLITILIIYLISCHLCTCIMYAIVDKNF